MSIFSDIYIAIRSFFEGSCVCEISSDKVDFYQAEFHFSVKFVLLNLLKTLYRIIFNKYAPSPLVGAQTLIGFTEPSFVVQNSAIRRWNLDRLRVYF